MTNILGNKWFSKPNAYVEKAKRHLSPCADKVYDVLSKYRNIQTGACFPSEKLIGFYAGLSDKSVKKGVRELKIMNLIYVEQEKNKYGKYKHNSYILTEPEHWLLPKGKKLPTDTEVSIFLNRREKFSETVGKNIPPNNTSNINTSNKEMNEKQKDKKSFDFSNIIKSF